MNPSAEQDYVKSDGATKLISKVIAASTWRFFFPSKTDIVLASGTNSLS